MNSSRNSIEVRDAFKSYGKGEDRSIVLNGLNMNVEAGSIYSLIGASGCGKTTLLSCILGMRELDSGVIKALNHKVSYEKATKVGHLIGYMPQEIALVPELTIKEILYYFGNIFQMDEKFLKERFELMKELLELPDGNQRIENISGGQKRRVSLAAALIHNPLVLILDEPTVGQDTILRDKIWKFLIYSTKTSSLSVIVTTHYISEAQQANRCGLMRDGVLLTEDSPKNIMRRFGAENLDEAFLNLCLLKQRGCEEVRIVETLVDDEMCEEENSIDEIDTAVDIKNKNKTGDIERINNTVESFEKRKKFTLQTIQALLTKEYIRIKRQYAEFFFILMLPIIQILLFAYGIGGYPIGLKIGIINGEVSDYSQCTEYFQLNGSIFIEDECHFQNASCHFLNEIRDVDAIKIFYNSFDDAFKDAKQGKISGFIKIPADFSNLLTKLHLEVDDDSFESSQIEIHLDQSNLQTTTFLQYRIYTAHQRFTRKLLRGCNLNEKYADLPIRFENPLFGSFIDDFKQTMAPVFLLQSIFMPAMGFSSYSIAQSRVDGVWNRTLLAGVRPLENLFTQVLLSMIVVFISFVETVVMALMTLDLQIVGQIWLLLLLVLFTCLAGSFTGIFASTCSDSLKFLSLVMLAFSQMITNLCGSFWPLEGQPTILKYFSCSLPFTLPAISARDIMIKGAIISSPSVLAGFGVLLGWIIVSLSGSYLILKKRRFS